MYQKQYMASINNQIGMQPDHLQQESNLDVSNKPSTLKPNVLGEMTKKDVFITHIHLLNGPNLNLLGLRQPEIYGHTSLNDVIKHLQETISAANQKNLNTHQVNHTFKLTAYQTNHEGDMIDYIHQRFLAKDVNYFIINLGAWTHTSIALRDAFLTCQKPIIEVHLSNLHQRENYRQHSYFSDIAKAVIVGCGHLGYCFALDYILNQSKTSSA
jgi:3-dehydroquinate dehydratase II